MNQGKGDWKLPAKPYWPKGSTLGNSGRAIDIPLPPPEDGVSTVKLGPFDFGGQVVTSLHFAVRYGEDEWESNDGTNFNFEVGGELMPWALDQYPLNEELKLSLPHNEFGGSPVYLNGKLLNVPSESEVVIPMTHLTYGENQITLKAEIQDELKFSRLKFFHQPELSEVPVSESVPLGGFESSGWETAIPFLRTPCSVCDAQRLAGW